MSVAQKKITIDVYILEIFFVYKYCYIAQNMRGFIHLCLMISSNQIIPLYFPTDFVQSKLYSIH